MTYGEYNIFEIRILWRNKEKLKLEMVYHCMYVIYCKTFVYGVFTLQVQCYDHRRSDSINTTTTKISYGVVVCKSTVWNFKSKMERIQKNYLILVLCYLPQDRRVTLRSNCRLTGRTRSDHLVRKWTFYYTYAQFESSCISFRYWFSFALKYNCRILKYQKVFFNLSTKGWSIF